REGPAQREGEGRLFTMAGPDSRMNIGGVSRRSALLALSLLAACAAPQKPPSPAVSPTTYLDVHIPAFARLPYAPFSRVAAIQIAEGEWRAFNSPVVTPTSVETVDEERENGLWQRVGLYWWLALDPRWPQQRWTGKHDQNGEKFPVAVNGYYAWSAAFISYVMRLAGAGNKFVYSEAHTDYINAARRHGLGEEPGLAITAEPPQSYAPQPGDLVCEWRAGVKVSFDDLPTPKRFPSHCDIVVGREPGLIDGIGGNLNDAVAMEKIPVTADGHLANPDGTIVDPDRPWFVVIKVDYDR
ncbi:MAG TPA: DUF2272 domain-containing protein, partial [Stellaceae bacterium]|nr:DUF2272 domain-containing protein [Stellaceae bacterium]